VLIFARGNTWGKTYAAHRKALFPHCHHFLIIGIAMGLNMAMSQDHSAIGAHAHAGNPAMEPVVAIASLITFAGVLLFAVIIFSDETSPRPATAAQ
jgi:hypothetical protein